MPATPKSKTKTECKNRELAVKVVYATTASERDVLLKWAGDLLAVKQSTGNVLDRTKRAISVTSQSKAVVPLVKLLARETKRLGWDERGLPARIALSAATIALVSTGQGAGIAALGGAIGLPLWVVFGAGGAFLGVLIEEIQKARKLPPAKKRSRGAVTPARKRIGKKENIIDADFVEVSPPKPKRNRKRI